MLVPIIKLVHHLCNSGQGIAWYSRSLRCLLHSIVMGFWQMHNYDRWMYINTLGCVHIRSCTFIIHVVFFADCR